VTVADDVEALYRKVLSRWNERDSAGYAALFALDGSMVGFDGSSLEGSTPIAEHLQSIFADHKPATYIAKVLEVRTLGSDAALLRSVVGMVPPGKADINPDLNAVQSLSAVRTDAGWRVAHFQNTPAAFHGRPEAVEALSAVLRAQLGDR
jgi:uncharacterized protein (TIGR02246 family)